MLDHTQGNAYGVNLALPQNSGRVKLPNHYLELGYKKEINAFVVDIKAGVKSDAFDSKDKLGPDGVNFMNMVLYDTTGSVSPITFTNGIYGEHLARQRMLYQSLYLKYKGLDKHILTTGYRYVKEETVDMVSKLSNWATGDATLVDYTDIYPFFDKNAKRDTLIFSLQDEYQLNDSLGFIYGFNYEQTSNKDAGVEPRVSMVYKIDTNNIFKAIYSRSHRNPSWQEMYTMNNHSRVGNTNLEPEKVDAFELAYVKKYSADTYLQTNLFYLLNKNQIYHSASDPQYKNVLDTDLYGLELEYKGHISNEDQLYLNYSYVGGTSNIQGAAVSEPLSNVSHHLAKGYYIYRINDSFSLSALAKYVSSKERASGDIRNTVEAYSTLDSALSYKNKRYDFTLMLSLKNIFDTKVTYPSPPKTYSQDYEQERRNFLIALKKEF
jgi:iron complex outermembrane receptor protein